MSEGSPPSSPSSPLQGRSAAPSPGGATQAAARLIVERNSEEDARQRQIVLSLDGEPLATLLYGQQVTREIPAGPHRLKVHNTLVWKTIAFDAIPGADTRFTVVNRAARGMMWMVALLGAGPMFVTVERR